MNARARDGTASSGSAPVPSLATVASAMADPRIDDAIEEVDDEVDADHQCGDEQDAALHYRVVARLHAVYQPVADARPRENRLGEDRARQQQPDLQPDHGDH